MEMFELLLRIRESVGPVVFYDAWAILESNRAPHPPPPRRRAGKGKRRGGEVGADVGGGAGAGGKC